jgi:hypothetical protein
MIFLPSFWKLNVEGKRAAVIFLKTLEFDMTVEQYCPLIVSFLADKSESFRELARPLIEKFLTLPDSVVMLQQRASQCPPAVRNLILSRLQTLERRQVVSSIFKELPTAADKAQREQEIDPLLPLRVLNRDEEDPLVLVQTLERYADRFFLQSIISTETEVIEETCSLFLEIENTDFEHFSLILDLILLWWANNALQLSAQEGYNQILQFLVTLLDDLHTQKRNLSVFEFSILLPTILECYGRDEDQWESVVAAVLDICDKEEVLAFVVKLLGLASSIYTIIATFNALMKMILPVTNRAKYIPELIKSAKKIQGIVGDDEEQNPELFAITAQFLNFIRESAAPRPTSSPARTAELPAEFSVDDPGEQPPSILVYRWIADLAADDDQLTIPGLKAIYGQMKKDATIFEKHVDALVVLLISLIHINFRAEHPPVRVCKYALFCLMTIFNEATLAEQIRKEFIQQIIYELLTHLSNGVSKPVLSQVLNAILVKLIEDCAMFGFMGFITAIGEYRNLSNFSEKWIRLALKCFEACGTRICEVGDIGNIVNTVILDDRFFVVTPEPDLSAMPLGDKIAAALTAFVRNVVQGFGEHVRKRENIARISQNSLVRQLLS